MTVPVNAASDFWVSQDYVQRVMDALWNRGDDPTGERRRALLEAIDAVDPHADDWKHNDANYPHNENPFKTGNRAFDVVSDNPRPDLPTAHDEEADGE